jgi:uncharacterized NAD-dependent epimerase/dehydratase family protein
MLLPPELVERLADLLAGAVHRIRWREEGVELAVAFGGQASLLRPEVPDLGEC